MTSKSSLKSWWVGWSKGFKKKVLFVEYGVNKHREDGQMIGSVDWVGFSKKIIMEE